MSKLTKEILSAYLPWEVMCLNQHLPDVEFVQEELIGISNYVTWGGIFNARHGSNHVPVSVIKLILRPLSDLTKEIEHNGERFVPIEYFLGDDDVLILNAVQINDLSYLPYNLIQKLLSWNFDIFGLIESGLAVNLNEIEK